MPRGGDEDPKRCHAGLACVRRVRDGNVTCLDTVPYLFTSPRQGRRTRKELVFLDFYSARVSLRRVRLVFCNYHASCWS